MVKCRKNSKLSVDDTKRHANRFRNCRRLSLSLFVITIKTYPMDLTEIDLSFGAIAKRFACKRKSILPLTLKLIIIINVFYCEVRGMYVPGNLN